MVEEILETENNDIFDQLKRNLSLENNPSSLLSFLSSVTASQTRILNFIFASEMMALESYIRGDGENPIMDVYNAMWLYVNLNMFFKEKYADKMAMYTRNTARAAVEGIKWSQTGTPMKYSVQQQLVALINENSMKYVTKLGDDIKVALTTELKQSVLKGETVSESVGRLTKVLNGNASRAKTIVRTETMRAANSASYAQALSENKGYYVVDSRAEACVICKRQYIGKVFDINDRTAMPPLHPNCACIPVFFDNMKDAKAWAGVIESDINKQVEQIEKSGVVIPKDGTGRNSNR